MTRTDALCTADRAPCPHDGAASGPPRYVVEVLTGLARAASPYRVVFELSPAFTLKQYGVDHYRALVAEADGQILASGDMDASELIHREPEEPAEAPAS
jgi:hypothetical protein